jgi:hypothetical protein
MAAVPDELCEEYIIQELPSYPEERLLATATKGIQASKQKNEYAKLGAENKSETKLGKRVA